MREAFVGFDSAWAGKAPGGIAWATFEGDRLAAFTEPKLARFDEAARIIETLRSECDYVLVAVDQPTLVPNETGSRPVDRIARCLISKLGSGVQPANRGRGAFFGSNAPIWRFLERLGACENPPAARTSTHGLHLLEVFPALALPSLQPEILKRRRAARYNPTKRTFSCDDWRLVAGCIRCRASALGMAPLSHWAGQQIGLAVPIKCDQDRLDAAICLVVALEWRRAPRDRVAVIGDGRKGYMVTPVSPETREILEQAAIATGVPFDAAWQDPERSPNSTRRPRRISMNDQRTAALARPGTTRPRSGRRDGVVFDQTLLRCCLVQVARAGRTMTYGDVARRFGIPWSQGASAALVSALKGIEEENRRRREPLLMTLVVSKKSGMPGRGFFLAIGIGPIAESERHARHQEHLRQVWAFDWPD